MTFEHKAWELGHQSSREKKAGDGDIGLSKSCSMPRKKKQRREKAEVNAPKHDLPQDFMTSGELILRRLMHLNWKRRWHQLLSWNR
ncbi:hypothetical protein CRYUN_Cryun41cG0069700 [Craigia yunnanensis]